MNKVGAYHAKDVIISISGKVYHHICQTCKVKIYLELFYSIFRVDLNVKSIMKVELWLLGFLFDGVATL